MDSITRYIMSDLDPLRKLIFLNHAQEMGACEFLQKKDCTTHVFEETVLENVHCCCKE